MKIDCLPFKNFFYPKVSKIKVFCSYLSSENFALLQNSYIWKLTFYHLKTFFYPMVSRIKYFCNYLNNEIFALLQNSYIWKLSFYHLKTFFTIWLVK